MSRWWLAFLRVTIILLALLIAGLVYLSLAPGALVGLVSRLNLPGVMVLPQLGPTPPPPRIDAPRGNPPGGWTAFTGVTGSGQNFACAFLLELERGQLVAVSSAHTTLFFPAATRAELQNPSGESMAHLSRRLAVGSFFTRANLSMDYALWAVESVQPGAVPHRPDPRGLPQPGEGVLVYGRSAGESGSRAWTGTVATVSDEAVWVQMDDSFEPVGFSGCPVVSRHTGRLVGMVIAGADRSPVVLGLHPARSLVEKAIQALGE